MKSEWRTVALGSVADLTVGFVGTMASNYTETGIPFLRSTNIEPFDIKLDDIKYISSNFNESLRKSELHPNDVVIVRTGTPGACAVIPAGVKAWNCSDLVIVRPHRNKLNPLFLASYVNLASGVINTQLVGAVQQHYNVGAAKKMQIPLPPIGEQDKIASIIGMLNKKITINSKINDNLQQQAQAIYSSMFIDNPDPAWSHGHLSDLITVKYGKDHKKLADGIYPVYGSGGIMRYVERPLYNKESVLIPRKGTLNNVMYVNQPFWSVDTMFYTEMKLPNVAKFVYHFVKAKDLASMNAGSAVPSMTTDILNAMEVVIPSASALEEFESLVAPMYEAMEANDVQSKALSQIRDTLLPKLMSGEIDVSDVQL